MKSKTSRNISILSLIFYSLMVLVNGLANYLPINNITTGQVSDIYPNLFAPIAFTFAIWGLIYLGLLAYIIYDLRHQTLDLSRINIGFIATSLINISWILAWHYDHILLSLALIFLLFLVLGLINNWIYHDDRLRDNRIVSLAFGLYYGWMTIAFIANMFTYLSSRGFSWFGLGESNFTSLIILLGLVFIVADKKHNNYYLLACLWAYFGILAKQLSKNYYNLTYGNIIIASGLAALVVAYKIYRRRSLGKF